MRDGSRWTATATCLPSLVALTHMIEAAPKTEEIPTVDAYARETEAGRS